MRGPLTLFALQLALNLGWTVVFFGLQKIGSSVATIVVFDVAVLVTTLAFRSGRSLGGLADDALSRLGGLRHGSQRHDLAPQSHDIALPSRMPRRDVSIVFTYRE